MLITRNDIGLRMLKHARNVWHRLKLIKKTNKKSTEKNLLKKKVEKDKEIKSEG